jgi:phosphoribosylglycinamide formyltransferase 1
VRPAIPPSSCTPHAHSEAALSERLQNLLVDTGGSQFAQGSIHHELEELDRAGIRPLREHQTPERILGWIDAEFGGTASLEAAAGGIWIAEDDDGPLAYAAFDARGLRYHWLQHWRNRPTVGMFGPIGVTERARGRGIGGTLVRAAIFSLRERGYRQALIAATPPELVPYFERTADAWFAESVDPGRGGRRWRATVLASGHGVNFQAVLDASRTGTLPLEVTALVANRRDAYALERAATGNVPATLVSWNRREEPRDAFDARVIDAVASTEPEVVLLLGWMHVLPFSFVARFPEALNLHPAFLPLDPACDEVTMPDGSSLPAFRGAHAFDDAVRAGRGWSGASVHRLGAAVDRGELFARAPLRIGTGDDRTGHDQLRNLEQEVVATAVRSWSYQQR